MAKAINLYQGQAPSAFNQMGAGLAEAGAGIAKAIQSGSSQLGAGINSAVNTAVNEYANYKDMKSSVTASEKAYETLRSFLPKELQFAMDSQLESMGSDTGISLNDKKQFWEKSNAMLGSAVKQAMDIQRQQEAERAAAARQQAEIDAAAKRQREMLDEQAMAPYRQQAAQLLNNPMPGTDFGAGQRFSAPPKPQRTDFFGNLVN